MSDIKEVRVAMIPADEKALSRPTRRRRRTQQAGAAAEEPVAVKVAAPPAPQPQAPAPQPQQPPQAPAQPAQPTQPSIATPISTQPPKPTVGGVRIQTRKRVHGSSATKILPTKRLPVKKPRLIIAVPKVPTTPTAAPQPSKAAAPTQTPQPSKAAATVATRRVKRRFTERRLSISLKNMASTRKQRRSIKKRVAAMPVADIRKELLERGILRPESNPPEPMLRSLMRDFLALKESV